MLLLREDVLSGLRPRQGRKIHSELRAVRHSQILLQTTPEGGLEEEAQVGMQVLQGGGQCGHGQVLGLHLLHSGRCQDLQVSATAGGGTAHQVSGSHLPWVSHEPGPEQVRPVPKVITVNVTDIQHFTSRMYLLR